MIQHGERRRYPRQNIALPIELRSVDVSKRRPLLEATTSNISASGLYVHCSLPEPPAPGTRVAVRVFVPDARIDRYSFVKFNLKGLGTVVRIDARGTEEVPLCGLAVAFDQHLEFENFMIL
jgi:hypothetical protein